MTKNEKIYPSIIKLPWNAYASEFWFSNLSDYQWSILLHSGYSNHSHSRFDILVADPICTLVTRGNTTEVSLKEVFTSKEDPLILLKKIINNFDFNIESNPDIPFQGGAVGLFGYDLARRFEKLPNKNALNDISIPDMAIGIYDWTLIVDHYKQEVSLLSYFDIKKRLTWLEKQQKINKSNFRLVTPWNSNMNASEYAEKFNKIQDYLRNGDCYQVNFAQRFQAEYDGDEWRAFVNLNKKINSPFSAFLRLKEGVILSFSPERFIKLCNGYIQARPIKGTIPRNSISKIDKQQIDNLVNCPKNRAENLMIVDLLRNDIGRVAIPGTVKVPELFVVESFSTIHHLVSTITASLSPSYNFCDLIRSTFPSGSVTGAPKIKAMEIIDELEPHCRNAWCGSIGYLSFCGCMDTNITIRTLIAFNSKIYCAAGGGIISDSKLQDEYQETFYKVNAIMKSLK